MWKNFGGFRPARCHSLEGPVRVDGGQSAGQSDTKKNARPYTEGRALPHNTALARLFGTAGKACSLCLSFHTKIKGILIINQQLKKRTPDEQSALMVIYKPQSLKGTSALFELLKKISLPCRYTSFKIICKTSLVFSMSGNSRM